MSRSRRRDLSCPPTIPLIRKVSCTADLGRVATRKLTPPRKYDRSLRRSASHVNLTGAPTLESERTARGAGQSIAGIVRFLSALAFPALPP